MYNSDRVLVVLNATRAFNRSVTVATALRTASVHGKWFKDVDRGHFGPPLSTRCDDDDDDDDARYGLGSFRVVASQARNMLPSHHKDILNIAREQLISVHIRP